jgi:hypothetical protein
MVPKNSDPSFASATGQLLDEEVISLPTAAKLLPRRRGGKKVHTSTIYRWTVTGLRGIVLESLQIGGTRCTSREALQRFFERLNRVPTFHRSPTTLSQQAKQSKVVEKQLDDLGV